MNGRICTVMPAMMPAAQASAPPMSQVARITASTSTPTTRASAGFSDTACIERPMVVRVITSVHGGEQRQGDRHHEKLVGGNADAGAERNGDLDVAAEIRGFGGEQELEQGAQRHRGSEARHHHDDGIAARPKAAEQQGVERQRQQARQRHRSQPRREHRPAERERPERQALPAARTKPMSAGEHQRRIGRPRR